MLTGHACVTYEGAEMWRVRNSISTQIGTVCNFHKVSMSACSQEHSMGASGACMYITDDHLTP